jgi:nicotinamidase-related amidase
MMDSLFEILDVTNDGAISRSDLHQVAKRMGWHWAEAPFFALLDLLTINNPIPKKQFNACMQQIKGDPMGPYGRVLKNSAHFLMSQSMQQDRYAPNSRKEGRSASKKSRRKMGVELVSTLGKTPGAAISDGYQKLLKTHDPCRIFNKNAALLIIDPQKSFTQGVWMESLGAEAASEVEPIVAAFKNCSRILKTIYGRWEIMFTRCPFPPDSYDWEDNLAEIIDERQLYFIKPGNSVLVPPLNGFREWVERCIKNGKNTLVIGGCTLNSCVRVSAIEIQKLFKCNGLRIIVDLSICGARTQNYLPTPIYNGLSAVESAIEQMSDAGAHVVRRVEWGEH